MSIVNTFLSKSAIVAGLFAMTLTTLPASNAAAQVNSRVIGNNNSVVINNSRGGRGGYNRGYRGHRGGGNGGALLAGVVGGAILFSALNSSRSSRYDNHYYDRPRYRRRVDVRYGYSQPRYGYPRYSPRTRVVYVDRPVETVAPPVYAQPTQAYYNQQPVSNGYQQQRQNSSCMQSREYQTTIEVGGRPVPAYGQACLQPDGSWKFGDPIAEPAF